MPAHRPTVADAMLTSPARTGRADSAADARRLLDSEHRHVALVVDERGVLLTVVARGDVVGVSDDAAASGLGRLDGRVVSPGDDLEVTRATMLAQARRRLAVVDDTGRLLGLLCLKSHGQGFCTAETVAERYDG